MVNFYPYSVLLAIATNIPQRLKTGFVLQVHIPHMYTSLVFGDEFVARLKSHQRCSAAFCRPVKFFHTD